MAKKANDWISKNADGTVTVYSVDGTFTFTPESDINNDIELYREIREKIYGN